MNSNNHQSKNETVDFFNLASSKLENIINQSLKNSEVLEIPEIIEVYYQVINIMSLMKFLRTNFKSKGSQEENKLLFIRIQEIEKHIDKKFDNKLHPLIMSRLKKLVEDAMKNLKDSKTQRKKTKEELEIQAKMYENLRQLMSTKEFVVQYQKGLSNSTLKI